MTNNGATSERFADEDVPFRDAMIVAEPLVVKEPAAMLNPMLPVPAGTVTLTGAVMLPLVLNMTTCPPANALPLSVTVQVDVCCGLRDVGVQVRPVTRSGITSERFADEDVPFSDALMLALPFAVKDPAAMLNARLPAPAGTVTLAGAVMLPVVVNGTACPLVGALPLSASVQVDVCRGLRDVGLQVNPVTRSGATNERFADDDDPFSDAVMLALPLAVKDPAAMVNARLPAPAGMVMLVGAVTLPVEPIARACPPIGALPLSVTVQLDACCGLRDDGAQVSPVTSTGASSVRAADFDALLKDTTTVAVLFVVIEPAVSVNVALTDPAGTVIVAGPVSAPMVPIETGSPPAGAFPLSETVHVEVCWEFKAVGLQARLLIDTGLNTVREAFPELTPTAAPSREDASVCEKAIVPLAAPAANETCTSAMTPSVRMLELTPVATQVNDPEPPAQLRVFEAAANADPAVALMAETLEVG